MSQIDKQFVIDNLLTKKGNLNPRALEKFSVGKEVAYQVFHGLAASPACKTCSRPSKFISFSKGYTRFCSVSCASSSNETVQKRKSTVQSNYGGYNSKEITERKKQTSRQNYGVDWANQSDEHVKTLKAKWLDEYGVSSFTHGEQAIKKRTATNLEKYGCTNPMQSEVVKNKVSNTNISRYGVRSVLMLEKNREKSFSSRRDQNVYELLNDKNWLENNKAVPSTLLAESLGIAWSTVLAYFNKHGIDRDNCIVSSAERKLHNLLQDCQVRFEIGNREILNGREIDIYLPNHKIGIEVDGLYWHTDQFITDPNYHLSKTVLAKEKSIQLLHITDHEVNNKFEIVKNRLYNKLNLSPKLYARKFIIEEISNKQYRDYIISNHIQGYAPASVRISLVQDGQIQALMSFSKSRYNRNYEWELIRYVSKHTVVGGASRLFKYFINKYSPESVISYADLRWNTGAMYEKIGMSFLHKTAPNYWYVTDQGLVHRSSFQKHKLKTKIDNYDPSKTEWENMRLNNFHKFWDCGNNVYIWKNNNEN